MKNIKNIFWACLGLLSLAACAGDNAGGDVERLRQACMDNSNMGEKICACVAEKAGEELSEGSLGFLIASLEGDQERAAQLRGELPLSQMTKSGMFMVQAPTACAQDQ